VPTTHLMGNEFSVADEATARRITGQISKAELDLLKVGVGPRVLDTARRRWSTQWSRSRTQCTCACNRCRAGNGVRARRAA
jgi:hypothetical protein